MKNETRDRINSGRAVVLVMMVLIIALVPRIVGLGSVICADGATWLNRSVTFVQALKGRDFSETYTAPHPGVTVTALSGLSLGAYVQASLASRGENFNSLGEETETYAGFVKRFPYVFVFAKLPIALLTACCVVLILVLLWQIIGPGPALVAAVVLATDPFLVAHSRLVHLDATLALLMSSSMLAFIHALLFRKRWSCLGSGFLGGCALLTRLSALFLLPFGVLLVVAAILHERWQGHNREPIPASIRVRQLIVFCLMMSATFVVLFPAMWTGPGDTLRKVFGGSVAHVTGQSNESHEEPDSGSSIYFKGRVVDDPGAAYYLAVMGYRSLAWVLPLCGIALLRLAFFRRSEGPIQKFLVVGLFGYAICYGLAMCLVDFKADRYYLPVFIALDIIGGLELALIAKAVQKRIGGRNKALKKAPLPVATGLVLCVAVYTLYRIHPNYLSYFNPAFHTASSVAAEFQIGWGEGLREAAQYLNKKPDASNLVVASSTDRSFSPFFVGKTIDLYDFQEQGADYLVLYANYVQRNKIPGVTDVYYSQETPERTITLNGITYAWIYKVANDRNGP